MRLDGLIDIFHLFPKGRHVLKIYILVVLMTLFENGGGGRDILLYLKKSL